MSAIVLGTIALAFGTPAMATDHLTGTVLAVDRSAHTATIAHQPFAGMPAMTMTFTASGPDLDRLASGEKIAAGVDRTHEPWLLEDVRVRGATPLIGADVPAIRFGDELQAPGLVDQRGRAFSFADLRGKTVALAFIYTRCKDAAMCPLVSGKFAQLQTRIDPAKMALVELTLDPAYDTPAVLARYGTEFDLDPTRWTLAGGDAATLARLAAGFDLAPRADAGTLIHGERLIVLDPAGRVADIIDGNDWTVPGALADLQSVAGIAYNPVLRLIVHATWGVESICGLAPTGSPLALHHAGFALLGVPLLGVLIVAFIRETRRSKRSAA
jgi:protein SCO1/2